MQPAELFCAAQYSRDTSSRSMNASLGTRCSTRTSSSSELSGPMRTSSRRWKPLALLTSRRDAGVDAGRQEDVKDRSKDRCTRAMLRTRSAP
eukprot:scaffold7595_cov267-Pinguiococcus_pyrenoidosus.AAC.6